MGDGQMRSRAAVDQHRAPRTRDGVQASHTRGDGVTGEGEAIQAESLGQPLAQKIEAKDAVAEAWWGGAVVENGDGQTVQPDMHTERGQGLQDLAERQVAHEDTLG